MADPTSAINLAQKPTQEDTGRHIAIIKDSEALMIHGLAAIDISTGYMEFADDAENLVPCGMVMCAKDGITNHLTGSTTYKYEAVARGKIIQRWAVTGASGLSDNGKPVYATDGQTLTLTPPTAGLPFGFIVKWISSTLCDVYFYSFAESLKQLLSGKYTNTETMELGTYPSNALQGTAAVTLRQWTSSAHYQFVSLHAQCVAHDDGVAAGSQAINLDIGGTNVTGGVLTIAATDVDAAGDMGAVIDATAITAENEVHTGDTVKLEMAASGTGFTADKCAAIAVYAIIKKLPGA